MKHEGKIIESLYQKQTIERLTGMKVRFHQVIKKTACLLLIFFLFGDSLTSFAEGSKTVFNASKPHLIVNRIFGAGDGKYGPHSFMERYNQTEELGASRIDSLKDQLRFLLRLTAYDEVYCEQESADSIKQLRAEADALLKKESASESECESLIANMEQARAARTFKHQADVTSVYITTDNGIDGSYKGNITKPMGYVKSQIVIVDVSGDVVTADDNSQIKVRGNTTAYGGKRPYNFKLSAKTDLFGFGKSKKWALLADWYDPTLMRNALALDLAQKLGDLPAIDHKPVEVWMDGIYQGFYLLTERIEANEDRVDINEKDGDFMVELAIPLRAEEGNTYFYSAEGKFFRLREPEEPSVDTLMQIKSTMSSLHTVLSSGDYGAVKELIDVDSFVSYYVLNEYLQTCDFEQLSVYFYYKDGKFYAGPPWDFDNSAGLKFNKPWSSWGAFAAECHYYKQLMQYPQFVEAVYQKYMDCGNDIQNIYQKNGWIDRYLALYGNAIHRNLESALAAYSDPSY